MIVPETLVREDRDRQFDDWGEMVTYRRVAESFDPKTQLVIETPTDTSLTAIVLQEAGEMKSPQSSQHLKIDIAFLVKIEDLPTAKPTIHTRIVYSGNEYDVIGFDNLPRADIVQLGCRKR